MTTKKPARWAAETTADNPWPLRLLTHNIHTYVDKMSEVWVEGQVVEYNRRGSTRTSFFTLRDPNEDVSMTVTAFGNLVESAGSGFQEGAQVVVRVKPSFWEKRGSLSLFAREIRVQGLGSLLAQIEQLRRRLGAEGLFSQERKRPLPFIPRRIGLVCGRDSKAEHDVVQNSFVRWPAARFLIREVAVQGQFAVEQVSAAIMELDAVEDVDVIVVARGGGAVEDLLPFSDEHLVRTVAACTTPVVSAIGHETDAPLLDLVADYRASTPTDAARRVVPDFREESADIDHLLALITNKIGRLIARERELLSLILSRPVLTKPTAALEQQRAWVGEQSTKISGLVRSVLATERSAIGTMAGALGALSPQATLERGYSILRLPSGQVVTEAAQLRQGQLVEGMLAQGTFVASVVGANPEGSFISKPNKAAEEKM